MAIMRSSPNEELRRRALEDVKQLRSLIMCDEFRFTRDAVDDMLAFIERRIAGLNYTSCTVELRDDA